MQLYRKEFREATALWSKNLFQNLNPKKLNTEVLE